MVSCEWRALCQRSQVSKAKRSYTFGNINSTFGCKKFFILPLEAINHTVFGFLSTLSIVGRIYEVGTGTSLGYSVCVC